MRKFPKLQIPNSPKSSGQLLCNLVSLSQRKAIFHSPADFGANQANSFCGKLNQTECADKRLCF